MCITRLAFSDCFSELISPPPIRQPLQETYGTVLNLCYLEYPIQIQNKRSVNADSYVTIIEQLNFIFSPIRLDIISF